MRPNPNTKLPKSRFQYLGERRGGGAKLFLCVGAHKGDAKTRRAAGDRRVANCGHEKAEFFERRARRKRSFFVAYDDGDDCRLAANRNAVARKFRYKNNRIFRYGISDRIKTFRQYLTPLFHRAYCHF